MFNLFYSNASYGPPNSLILQIYHRSLIPLYTRYRIVAWMQACECNLKSLLLKRALPFCDNRFHAIRFHAIPSLFPLIFCQSICAALTQFPTLCTIFLIIICRRIEKNIQKLFNRSSSVYKDNTRSGSAVQLFIAVSLTSSVATACSRRPCSSVGRAAVI